MSKDLAEEIHRVAKPFITWLQEAESESEEEEEEDGAGVEVRGSQFHLTLVYCIFFFFGGGGGKVYIAAEKVLIKSTLKVDRTEHLQHSLTRALFHIFTECKD